MAEGARILLLGGTAEARALSHRLSKTARLTVSLAGAVAAPAEVGGDLRVGGFGGADGLAKWLGAEGVRAVVDATHPFAARISANAAEAARRTGCPLVHLRRAAWTEPEGADWCHVADLAAAAAALPQGARGFLATGRGSLPAFASRRDCDLFLRVIDPVEMPPHIAPVVARPPFDMAAEIALFQRLGITHLVTKNAGGRGAYAKVEAAAMLGLPVIMVSRPPPPENVPVVARIEDVLAWLHTI